jgi:signal transduction histidine kinase
VKHIVRAHRGRVAVSSDVGSGATFTITLPAAVPVQVVAQEPATAGGKG